MLVNKNERKTTSILQRSQFMKNIEGIWRNRVPCINCIYSHNRI